jgi:hypothetical protein
MQLADLEGLLRPLGETRRRLDLPRTLTVALCAQLLAPGSELSTSHWLTKLLFTREPYDLPYHHLLRALGVLADDHQRIAGGLFSRVQHLFTQRVDVVFHGLAPRYFEGEGPAGPARRGDSRDGRPDCVPVMLGLAVTKGGFPIAYRVHPGSAVAARGVQDDVGLTVPRLPGPVGDLAPLTGGRQTPGRGDEFLGGLVVRRAQRSRRGSPSGSTPMTMTIASRTRASPCY